MHNWQCPSYNNGCRLWPFGNRHILLNQHVPLSRAVIRRLWSETHDRSAMIPIMTGFEARSVSGLGVCDISNDSFKHC